MVVVCEGMSTTQSTVSQRDGRQINHKAREAIRFRAVQLVQNGESPETVIKALGFTRCCIYQWLAAYRAGGWDGLRTGRIGGRPKKVPTLTLVKNIGLFFTRLRMRYRFVPAGF